MMTLHGYWRSSASYRVRIALALKGVEVSHKSVDLRMGAQRGADYLVKNPQGYVPVLELEDGTMLRQSLAIMDYLDATFREPGLMPGEALLRSKILAASLVIASDIAPIQNSSVQNYIRAEYGQGDAGAMQWAEHWISKGFAALEQIAGEYNTPFLMTEHPMLFECCLIPQVYNARRFGVDMSAYPKLMAIDAACRSLPEFEKAKPENQADAPQGL